MISRATEPEPGSVASGQATPRSLLLDPLTGVEEAIATPMWRPMVDPQRDAGVWWDGTVERTPDGFAWQPRSGRLVLGTWPGGGATTVPGAASRRPAEILATGTVSEWQVAWDPSGEHLAVWVADAGVTSLGHLSLYALDDAGAIVGARIIDAVPAYAGFSLASRPPGVDRARPPAARRRWASSRGGDPRSGS